MKKTMYLIYAIGLVIATLVANGLHAQAQENKEKKVTIKMVKKDGDKTLMDTLIIHSGDYDDEELEAKIKALKEKIEMDVQMDWDSLEKNIRKIRIRKGEDLETIIMSKMEGIEFLSDEGDVEVILRKMKSDEDAFFISTDDEGDKKMKKIVIKSGDDESAYKFFVDKDCDSDDKEKIIFLKSGEEEDMFFKEKEGDFFMTGKGSHKFSFMSEAKDADWENVGMQQPKEFLDIESMELMVLKGEEIKIKAVSGMAGKMKLSLMDERGKALFDDKQKSDGAFEFSLPADLDTGSYYVLFEQDGKQALRKLQMLNRE